MTDLLATGQTLTMDLGPFVVRLNFLDGSRLRLAVIRGENEGFEDEVDYVLERTGDVLLLSWQEGIGSTVIHAIAPDRRSSRSFVAAADGRLMRLTGRLMWS